jgi:hypothetical protein
MAKDAYSASTTYMENHLIPEWEKNERQFQSKHPQGSKYSTDDYRFRSKLFRPKTRSTIVSNEADCAFAFFTNPNRMDVKAGNDNDPLQQASKVVWQHVSQYRLTETVPWFHVVLGGYQDALKNDVCFAHTYWKYRGHDYTEVEPVTSYIPSDTQMGAYDEVVEEREVPRHKTLCDEPVIEVIPPENLRVSPNCDWTDPINSSPYLIHLMPMTVEQVMARMDATDDKTGEPKWKKYSQEDIQSKVDEGVKSMRNERDEKDPDVGDEGGKQPRLYDIVYIHRNFLRDERGRDWVFYTLGQDKPLSKPVLATEVFWHLRYGERPYVMGNAAIEAHKTYPDASVCRLTRDTQAEVNDFTNLRLDNVKLAVVGRHWIKRTANMDYGSLRKNIPGGGVLTDNPETDSRLIETKDVTASSFQEQARMDSDFGDIAGALTPSMLNARNEAGARGAQMMSSAATKVGDYRIMTFAQTFLQPLLGQFLRLLQAYETDETILTLAAEKGAIVEKFGQYGINQITDELLQQELTTTVNVGLGSTDPMGKVQRLNVAMQGAIEVGGPQVQQLIKLDVYLAELFNAVGFTDHQRFFHNIDGGEDPRMQQMAQMIQELQQAIETKQVEENARNDRMQELQDKKSLTSVVTTQMNNEAALQKEAMKGDADYDKQALANQGAVTNTIVGGMNGERETDRPTY